jgi:uncharacterized protein YndB with AHSA1/START domain
MMNESLSATVTIKAPAETVFAIIANRARVRITRPELAG